MKITLDLPKNLVRQIKRRAIHEGRKLKDVAAELLRDGLRTSFLPKSISQPLIVKDKKTGLPVIQCRRVPNGKERLTPERIVRILMDQEAEWARESA